MMKLYNGFLVVSNILLILSLYFQQTTIHMVSFDPKKAIGLFIKNIEEQKLSSNDIPTITQHFKSQIDNQLSIYAKKNNALIINKTMVILNIKDITDEVLLAISQNNEAIK